MLARLGFPVAKRLSKLPLESELMRILPFFASVVSAVSWFTTFICVVEFATNAALLQVVGSTSAGIGSSFLQEENTTKTPKIAVFREFETLTKEGYIKEGFVIDDNILDVGSGSESESESEPEIIPLKSIQKSTKNKPLKSSKPPKSTKTPKKSKIELEDTSILSPFLECKEELEEEMYFA